MSTANRARNALRLKLHGRIDMLVEEWVACFGEEDMREHVPPMLRAKACCLALPSDDQAEDFDDSETIPRRDPEAA